VRALRFSRGAQWHIAVPTPVEDVKWEDVTADAHTDMGKALAAVAEEMKVPPMKSRSLPPVLVLVSDGQPTDDFSVGLKKLMDQPWGRAAVRMAVAIGQDARPRRSSALHRHGPGRSGLRCRPIMPRLWWNKSAGLPPSGFAVPPNHSTINRRSRRSRSKWPRARTTSGKELS